MSALVIKLHTDPLRDQCTLCLSEAGLGRVYIDQLPFYGQGYGHSLQIIREELSAMYFYCAPRTTTKSITMTWDQAMQTAEFLKETI